MSQLRPRASLLRVKSTSEVVALSASESAASSVEGLLHGRRAIASPLTSGFTAPSVKRGCCTVDECGRRSVGERRHSAVRRLGCCTVDERGRCSIDALGRSSIRRSGCCTVDERIRRVWSSLHSEGEDAAPTVGGADAQSMSEVASPLVALCRGSVSCAVSQLESPLRQRSK